MPTLTRFRLTDSTARPSGKVRILLHPRGGTPLVKNAPRVSGSTPPLYEWQDAAGVNDVVQVDYLLDWDDPIWGPRVHGNVMQVDPNTCCIRAATVGVKQYVPDPNTPPAADYFNADEYTTVTNAAGTTNNGPAAVVMAYEAVPPF